MKKRTRTCSTCSTVEETFSSSPVCASCVRAAKKGSTVSAEKAHLAKLGYKVVGEPQLTDTGHRQYRLIAPCCGREFFPTYSNILKQLNSHGQAPCRWCGGEKRMAKAMQGYIEKHGREYDLEEYRGYREKVDKLSTRTYAAYRTTINPEGHRRGRVKGSWQLDHIVPVIWCFKNGVSPEQAASVHNLQMLKIEDNLSKGRRLLSDEDARRILSGASSDGEFEVEAAGHADLVSDITNVWSIEKVTVRQQEWLERREAVLVRLRHLRGQSPRIYARACELVQLEPQEANDFMKHWHVQGQVAHEIAYGLRFNGQLVMVATFGHPRYAHKQVRWELLRLCSTASVAGGASRLFKRFITDHAPSSIVSYSLERWGRGGIYPVLGFTRVQTHPSPRYLWPDGKLRGWRASILMARRRGILIKGGEIEGTTKVHDPGSTTWMWQTPKA